MEIGKMMGHCLFGLGTILFCFTAIGFVPLAHGQEYSEEAVQGLLFGVPDVSAEFHGIINTEYFDFQSQAEHPVPSFDIHNFYLAAKAEIGSLVTLYGEVEYEHGATVKLDRAFVDWEISSIATIRIGRFYVPLSYERVHYWAPVRLMTSRPLLVDLPFHEWSDTGIELFGEIGMFGYDLSLINGPFALTENGIPTVDMRDINRDKSWVARINFHPFPFLEGGLAYSQGRYDPADELIFRLYELDARLRHGPLDLWFEYERRTGDDEPCDTSSNPTCNSRFTGDLAAKQGYYIQLAYNLLQGIPKVHYLKPIVRYDEIRTLDTHAGQRRTTLGLNWSPQAHMVLKSEYQWIGEFGQVELRNNGFMLSFVVDF